jgi:predicted enzyme related to lactoylglutathione lyase
MITGAHVILYTQDAEADRAFIRDVLGFASVDAGEGWLIFKLPPSEVAVHPAGGAPTHELYLMCDDIEKALAELAAKGAEISQPPSDRGWGRLASIKLPSGADLSLYEPRHPLAFELGDTDERKR